MLDGRERDEIFLKLAEDESKKSPCLKTKVGAIIVRKGEIISSGFNEAPQNQPNCSEIGFCYRIANGIESGKQTDKCRAIGCHAEINAICNASRSGLMTDRATMYVFGNTEICNACRASITKSGIRRVVYKSKFGVVENIDVDYDWNIHPLDYERKFNEWKNNLNSSRLRDNLQQ